MTEHSDQIDKFLLGQLSKEDQQKFELQIAKDKTLANAVEEQRQALQLIEALGDDEVHSRLKKIADAHHNTTVKPFFLSRTVIQWAAVAAGVLVLIVVYFFVVQSGSSKDLYSSYFEIYPLELASRNEPNNQLLKAAYQAYENENFEAAIPTLEQAFEDNKDTRLLLGKAVSQMALNQFTAALETLEPLIQNKDVLYENHALWYAALCHLQLNNIPTAKQYLEALSYQEKAFNQAQAKRLLLKLK